MSQLAQARQRSSATVGLYDSLTLQPPPRPFKCTAYFMQTIGGIGSESKGDWQFVLSGYTRQKLPQVENVALRPIAKNCEHPNAQLLRLQANNVIGRRKDFLKLHWCLHI